MELADNAPEQQADENLIQKIAQLTRMLRESMRELGLDQAVKEAAHAIPDARDRLHYVARMTEQAANRVLNSAEQLQPLHEAQQREAEALNGRWAQWEAESGELASARALIDDSRALLRELPGQARSTQDALMDIIMAQDFQDLTGQVIMRMLTVITAIETELVQVLIDNVPADRREEAHSLLNGPEVSPVGKSDVVTSQEQVDDLLDSLGF